MALVNQKEKSKGGNLSCLSKSPDILNTDLFVLEKKHGNPEYSIKISI